MELCYLGQKKGKACLPRVGMPDLFHHISSISLPPFMPGHIDSWIVIVQQVAIHLVIVQLRRLRLEWIKWVKTLARLKQHSKATSQEGSPVQVRAQLVRSGVGLRSGRSFSSEEFFGFGYGRVARTDNQIP